MSGSGSEVPEKAPESLLTRIVGRGYGGAMTQAPNDHQSWMSEALKEAEKARGLAEVPVGAVVVCDGQIVIGGEKAGEFVPLEVP